MRHFTTFTETSESPTLNSTNESRDIYSEKQMIRLSMGLNQYPNLPWSSLFDPPRRRRDLSWKRLQNCIPQDTTKTRPHTSPREQGPWPLGTQGPLCGLCFNSRMMMKATLPYQVSSLKTTLQSLLYKFDSLSLNKDIRTYGFQNAETPTSGYIRGERRRCQVV